MIIEFPAKPYVDSLHQSSRNRRDLSSVFNDQDKELDNNKLTKLDGVTVNRDPISDNDLSTKKYIDNNLEKITILGFNQTLQNYLKLSVGNDVYNLINMIKDKLQIQQFLITPIVWVACYKIGF